MNHPLLRAVALALTLLILASLPAGCLGQAKPAASEVAQMNAPPEANGVPTGVAAGNAAESALPKAEAPDDPAAGQASRVPVETARIGVMDGSTNALYAEAHYPDANIQSFKNYVDSTAALDAGKLDYAMMDYTSALRFLRVNRRLKIAADNLTDEKLCLGIRKGEPELAQGVRAVVDKYLADGTMDEIIAHWIKPDGSDYDVVETPKLPDAPKVKVAIITSREPTTFLLEGRYAGLDIELIDRVLYELGKQAEYIDMDLAAVLASIESGKADMTLGLYSTPERAEKLLFTAPYFANPQVLVCRGDAASDTGAPKYTASQLSGKVDDGGVRQGAGQAPAIDQPQAGFWEGLKASFTRTFLTENRWKLVMNGLAVTVFISLCAALLGSLMGFGFCMLRRSKKRVAALLTAVFIRIIQGTPIVVLLMILYYIIFGKLDISAMLVAILGFAVNFGVYVSEMMRTGIDAVDKGQIEAAHALGFTRMRTFWKITFPQAARHFLPVFKGEFISMVKMTSVVGYIAIQDLTKVSDIIRSRTLEAFFPLIATAIIYFLVANLLTMLLSWLEVSLDPKRRSRTVKGVVTK
ncbi:MAG: ABC transporter substrate-binding protein/permease [Clostridia bacterium]